MKSTWHLIAVLLAVSLPSPSLCAGEPPAGSRIVVVSPNEGDARIAFVIEAIEFWARVFADLGLEPVLPEADVVVSPVSNRALETYARRISQFAGRPGSFDPHARPSELTAIDADVVVLLSTQKLMPFAWPRPGESRFFVAISAIGDDSAADATITRNVIAHELGHVVGLSHHDEPTTLMCLPCETVSRPEGPSTFRPLMPEDESRLVELYSGLR